MKTYTIVLISIFLMLFLVYDIMIWRIDQQIEAISSEIDILIEENQAIRRELETLAKTKTINEDTVMVSSEQDDILIDESYDEAITYLAKTVWGEARGLSTTERAAVVWCILNRVDSDLGYMPNDIVGVITQPHQFVGYRAEHPVDDDIKTLVVDVLERWLLEKQGVEDVGRVLPKEYLYFYGDGEHNHFTKEWGAAPTWDWNVESPYI